VACPSDNPRKGSERPGSGIPTAKSTTALRRHPRGLSSRLFRQPFVLHRPESGLAYEEETQARQPHLDDPDSRCRGLIAGATLDPSTNSLSFAICLSSPFLSFVCSILQLDTRVATLAPPFNLLLIFMNPFLANLITNFTPLGSLFP
jgi:hypothetical protein